MKLMRWKPSSEFKKTSDERGKKSYLSNCKHHIFFQMVTHHSELVAMVKPVHSWLVFEIRAATFLFDGVIVKRYQTCLKSSACPGSHLCNPPTPKNCVPHSMALHWWEFAIMTSLANVGQ